MLVSIRDAGNSLKGVEGVLHGWIPFILVNHFLRNSLKGVEGLPEPTLPSPHHHHQKLPKGSRRVATIVNGSITHSWIETP
jgi:hypothetical protein